MRLPWNKPRLSSRDSQDRYKALVDLKYSKKVSRDEKVSKVRPLLRDSSGGVRRIAVEILAGIGDIAVVASLLEITDDRAHISSYGNWGQPETNEWEARANALNWVAENLKILLASPCAVMMPTETLKRISTIKDYSQAYDWGLTDGYGEVHSGTAKAFAYFGDVREAANAQLEAKARLETSLSRGT